MNIMKIVPIFYSPKWPKEITDQINWWGNSSNEYDKWMVRPILDLNELEVIYP